MELVVDADAVLAGSINAQRFPGMSSWRSMRREPHAACVTMRKMHNRTKTKQGQGFAYPFTGWDDEPRQCAPDRSIQGSDLIVALTAGLSDPAAARASHRQVDGRPTPAP